MDVPAGADRSVRTDRGRGAFCAAPGRANSWKAGTDMERIRTKNVPEVVEASGSTVTDQQGRTTHRPGVGRRQVREPPRRLHFWAPFFERVVAKSAFPRQFQVEERKRAWRASNHVPEPGIPTPARPVAVIWSPDRTAAGPVVRGARSGSKLPGSCRWPPNTSKRRWPPWRR